MCLEEAWLRVRELSLELKLDVGEATGAVSLRIEPKSGARSLRLCHSSGSMARNSGLGCSTELLRNFVALRQAERFGNLHRCAFPCRY